MNRHYNKFFNFLKRIEENIYNSKSTILKNCERSIQSDNLSCGVHTVNAILHYYNIDVSIPELIRLLGTNEEGTDTKPILNILSRFNLDVEVNDSSSTLDIVKSVNNGYPMLITIDDWEHWIVVYGYSENGIFLLDSNRKNFHCHWHYRKFLERWDDNWIAIIKPNLFTNVGAQTKNNLHLKDSISNLSPLQN